MNDCLGTQSPFWPLPWHDPYFWRYSPIDVVPPLSLAWKFTAKRKSLLMGPITDAENCCYVVDITGFMSCLNEKGRLVYEYKHKVNGKKLNFSMLPTLIGDKIVAYSKSGISLVSPKDGKVLWFIENKAGRDRNNGKKLEFEEDFYGCALTQTNANEIVVRSFLGFIRFINIETGVINSSLNLFSTSNFWSCPEYLVGAIGNSMPEEKKWAVVHLASKQIQRDVEIGRFRTSPFSTVYRGRRFFQSTGDATYCVDADSGKNVWIHRFSGTEKDPFNTGLRQASDGISLFSQHGSQIISFDMASGRINWRSEAKPVQFQQSEIAVSPNYVYSFRIPGELTVLNKSNGKLEWAGNLHNELIPYWFIISNGQLLFTIDGLSAQEVFCLKGV